MTAPPTGIAVTATMYVFEVLQVEPQLLVVPELEEELLEDEVVDVAVAVAGEPEDEVAPVVLVEAAVEADEVEAVDTGPDEVGPELVAPWDETAAPLEVAPAFPVVDAVEAALAAP